MSIHKKQNHGPGEKCSGPPWCQDCSPSQSDKLEGIKVEPLKTPKIKLYVGTIAEGQVVFHAFHPEKSHNIETPHLYVIQKFCDLHGLELKDEVLSLIKSRLIFNSENQSYSVNPLQINVDDFMAIRSYLKQIENDIQS